MKSEIQSQICLGIAFDCVQSARTNIEPRKTLQRRYDLLWELDVFLISMIVPIAGSNKRDSPRVNKSRALSLQG